MYIDDVHGYCILEKYKQQRYKREKTFREMSDKKKRNLTDGMRIEDAITAGCKNMELDVSWFNEIKWSSDGLHFEEKIEHIKIIGSILKCKSKAVFLF